MLRLHDPFVSDRLTIVDLLSHRSGLPRHDLAWIGQPGRSRAEIVRSLRFLPLSRDLRQEFQYCNLGYLVAGHVVEALSGVPWEDFVRARLLAPLRMHRSNLSVADMLADGDHAAAYTPPGRRHRARAAPAADGHGAGRRDQLQRRRHGPVAARSAGRRAAGRRDRDVTGHG